MLHGKWFECKGRLLSLITALMCGSTAVWMFRSQCGVQHLRAWGLRQAAPSHAFSGRNTSQPMQLNSNVHLVLTTFFHMKPGHHGEAIDYFAEDVIHSGWVVHVYAKVGGSCDCEVFEGKLLGQCARLQNMLRPADKIRIIPNVGDECSGYLAYMLDNYYDLPDMTVFMQGFPYDTLPFPFTTVSRVSQCADLTRSFSYLTYFWQDDHGDLANYPPGMCKEEYVKNISSANSNLALLDIDSGAPVLLSERKRMTYYRRSSAQFAVHRDRMLSSPRILYQHLYDNVMGTNDVQSRCRHWACEGQICKQCVQMEQLWPLVFGSGFNESERGVVVNKSRSHCDPQLQTNLTHLIPGWLRAKFVARPFRLVRKEVTQRIHEVREKFPNHDHEGHTVLAQLYIMCAGRAACAGFVYMQRARPWILQRIPDETSPEGYLFSCTGSGGCGELDESLEHWTFIRT